MNNNRRQMAAKQHSRFFSITHSPGHMVVTDIPNSKLAIL
jgi:uncharacterized protein YcsI (UPF0317 family)